MWKRILISLLTIAFAITGVGASKDNSYKKISKYLEKSENDCVTMSELREIFDKSLSSFQAQKSTQKILEDIYTDTVAVRTGTRNVCPAELTLYFADEYYKYIQDPTNKEYYEELTSINGFSDLANMQRGRKRETWREFFIDRAIKTLQRTVYLANKCLERKIPFSTEEILSEEAIKEAEEKFFSSQYSCFGVPLSYLEGYILNQELATLAWDSLLKEYSHHYSPDEVSAVISIEIFKKSSSKIEYTPFIKIACLSNSDIN